LPIQSIATDKPKKGKPTLGNRDVKKRHFNNIGHELTCSSPREPHMREMAHADKVVASSAAINAFNTLKKQKDLSDAKFPT